jgi:hypothetical protein
MGQQCEYIDLGMSAGNFGEPSSVRIPRQRPGGAERDLGKFLLAPALQLRRRLDLYPDAARRSEIPGRPALPDTVSRIMRTIIARDLTGLRA